MDRKLIGALLLLIASGGCRACKSSCDYLPPVPDGHYPYPGGRAGSALGGGAIEEISYEPEIINPSLQALPDAEEM